MHKMHKYDVRMCVCERESACVRARAGVRLLCVCECAHIMMTYAHLAYTEKHNTPGEADSSWCSQSRRPQCWCGGHHKCCRPTHDARRYECPHLHSLRWATPASEMFSLLCILNRPKFAYI